MDDQHDETDSVTGLLKNLVADGGAYVKAEVDVYRHKALSWVPPVRVAAVLLIAAVFLVQAALTTLFVFVGFWLALWFGPLGGGVAAAILALVIAGLLAWLAVRQFTTKGKRT